MLKIIDRIISALLVDIGVSSRAPVGGGEGVPKNTRAVHILELL